MLLMIAYECSVKRWNVLKDTPTIEPFVVELQNETMEDAAKKDEEIELEGEPSELVSHNTTTRRVGFVCPIEPQASFMERHKDELRKNFEARIKK